MVPNLWHDILSPLASSDGALTANDVAI